jgi:integrase-like protein
MSRKPTSKRTRPKPKAVLRLPDLDQAKSAVLNSLTSADAQRGYRHAIDEFVEWYCSEPRLSFSRTVVLRYRIHLESRNLAPGTINLRLGAVRRLAYEAADCGLLSPDLAAGIRRVKGVKKIGVRLGNWLSAEQSQRLWQAPGGERLKEKRDRALLAVLLACGLRRHEAVELNLGHIQQREEHWAIVDLKGKAGHTRTIPNAGMGKECRRPVDPGSEYYIGQVVSPRAQDGQGVGRETDGKRRSGTSFGNMPRKPASKSWLPMIYAGPVLGCAMMPEANWSISSFCSVMSRFRQPSDILAANSAFAGPSMTKSE